MAIIKEIGTVAQPQQGKALPFEEYFKVVAAHAKGIKAKNGISMRGRRRICKRRKSI